MKVGDAVYSRPDLARNGTYAEFVAIRAGECARKPRTISHVGGEVHEASWPLLKPRGIQVSIISPPSEAKAAGCVRSSAPNLRWKTSRKPMR